jgi:hypothetical protein
MNYSTSIFLINNEARAVIGIYEPGDSAKRVMFKTLDPDIKVGDLVVVPTDTRFKFTVFKILEVDVDVDFDSAVPVDWIAGRFDKVAYEQVVAQEQKSIQVIKQADANHKKEELRAKIFASNSELKALEIYSLGVDEPADLK